MQNPRGLVVIHIDGLSYDNLQKALAGGYMPFVSKLLENEEYEILPYRCGIPSTTPFAQAGILYGDNSEIPAFRWWDKQAGLLVAFGANSSFKHVAHRYFRNCQSLVADGACIAACFPADAKDTFGLAYRDRDTSLPTKLGTSHHHLLIAWSLNPFRLSQWLIRGLWQIFKGNRDYVLARLRGQRAERMYVISDILEEIFLHQLTRYALLEAMDDNYSSIYAGFYAYDETAHAYGPESEYSFRILRHIDHSIRQAAQIRAPSKRNGGHNHRNDEKGGGALPRHYEFVLLSDHGQIATVPFDKQYGRGFGELVAEWLPTYAVEEYRGKHNTPRTAIDGHIALTYSGGLAHMYFKDISHRMHRGEIEERFPGLIAKVAHTPGIEFVMLRDQEDDLIVTGDSEVRSSPTGGLARPARDLLSRYDDPDFVAHQLHRLNLFDRAGDLIIAGKYEGGKQVNFEHQVGGHGSIGGEQLHPFVMAKREWGFKTERVYGAQDLHPLLMRLRKELLT